MVNASFAGAIRHAVHIVGMTGYDRVAIYFYASLGEYQVFGENEVVRSDSVDRLALGVKLLDLNSAEFRVLIRTLKTLQVELFQDGNYKKS